MKKLLIPVSSAICMLLFGGCAHNHDHEQAAASSATLGQQLDDLKKACDSKAISKKEYKEEKKRLLKDY